MPDVAVPAAPMLSNLRRVELVQTGDWIISSGRWKAARDDLVAAVAALDCPAVRRPVIKLGHSQGEEPLWQGNPTGAPAIGWIDSLTPTNQGHTLVGDLVGMPGWLASRNAEGQMVIASAWPDRSVEGKYDFRCQIGHTHPFVLTAVALLGVTPPGVGTLKSLQDVGRLFGVKAADDTGTTVVAHLKGEHAQVDHGNWADSPDAPSLDPADDKLNLAGRIRLGSGERLVGSGRVGSAPNANYTNAAVLAHIRTPDGPQLRLGVVDAGSDRNDTRRWSAANRGGTVNLDGQGIRSLREGLADATTKGRDHQKRYREFYDGGADPGYDPDDTLHSGVVESPWGDLVYRARGVDDEDGGWGVTLAVRPPDAGDGWEPAENRELDLSPARLRQLVKELESALTTSASADVQAHMMGRHNQETHGRRYGPGGNPIRRLTRGGRRNAVGAMNRLLRDLRGNEAADRPGMTGGPLTDVVRSVRDGVDGGQFTPDQALTLLSSLVFRPDVASNAQLSTALARTIGELRDGPGRQRGVDAMVQVEAAADVRTGAMVALLPSDEDTRRLAVDGGEPAGQLHVTVLFLGEADAYPPEARQAIVDEVRALAEVIPPGEVDGMAIAAFNPDKADKDTAIVVELGGEGLEDVHGLVEQAVTDVAAEHGLMIPEQHSPYRPHVTLLYSDDLMNVPKLADRAGPVRIDRIRVAFGGENVDIPLTGEGSDLDVDDLTDDDMPVAASDVEAQQSRRITRSDAPLRRYWLTGKGALRVRWNTPGDWTRCVRLTRRYLRDPKGYCAELHKTATGVWPGDRRNVGRRNASAPAEEAMTLPNPNPTIVHAAAKVSVDDIRAAFYAQAPNDRTWIREFRTEPRELIVADDGSGGVARVVYQVGDDGEITFGQPKRVRVEYVEDDPAEAETIAASRMVYASAAESRPTLVTSPPPPPGFEPAEPVEPEPDDPTEPTEPAAVQAAEVSNRPWSDFTEADYDIEQWRRACLLDRGEGIEGKARYGLPVREPSGALNRNGVHAAAGGHGIGAVKGISDEQRRAVAAKLVRLYEQLGDEPPDSLHQMAGHSMSASEDPHKPPAAEPDQPTKEDDMSLTEVRQRLGLADDADDGAVLAAIDEIKAKADTAPDPKAVEAAAAEKDELTKQVELLDTQVKGLTSQIAAAAEEKRAQAKAQFLDEAQRLGKFTPAEREQWEKDYDEAPGAVTRVLASIAEGFAVPVTPKGKVGDPWDVAASELPAEPEWLDGPNIDEPALAGKEN